MARASSAKHSAPLTFETVRRAALALPNVEEGTAWGSPAFRIGGKMFLCFRLDLESLVVAASFEQRDAMIAEDPETYYTTDHHRPYRWVLARLSKLHPSALPDLLQMALRSVPPPPNKRMTKRTTKQKSA
jgi:hypothetical protein